LCRIAVLAAALGAAAQAAAQETAPRPEAEQGAPRARGRAELESRVRQRIARVVQDRVRLDDEQMRRLAAVNERYDGRRRELVGMERQIRVDLRQELLAAEGANQRRVSQLLDQMLRVQRERLDLVEREQRELAAFMTPVQRARYLAIQDQIRRSVEELRERRGARGAQPPARLRGRLP
jgi:hypothetical protein